jgi:hypothetical protein
MATNRWKRNTAGLIAAVGARSDDARSRTLAAIDALVAERATVNFNTVAARAGVTKAYLYAHADLRDRVAALRVRQSGDRNRRIAELEAELFRLRIGLGS